MVNNFYKYVFGISIMCISLISLYISINSTETYKEDEVFAKKFNKDYNIYSLNIPSQIAFAGEEVPLHDFSVKEALDKELLVNTYWQSQTMLFIKRANRWFPVIEPILKKNNVPEDFKYLALIESGLTDIVSPAGATGFWQIMKSTGKEYGLEINGEIDERYHVEKSTEAACRYLSDAHHKFGSWTYAAASYNMGMQGLDNQIDRQKSQTYYDLLLNSETQRYVFRILAAKLILSNPLKFGFNFRTKDLYPVIPTFIVEVDSSISDMATFAIKYNLSYKTLKLFNPWLRDNYLSNKQKNNYSIKIPKEVSNIVNSQNIFYHSESSQEADTTR